MKHDPNLGKLSSKYESRGNAGAIGFDKVGGASYGTYQIASRVGTMKQFLNWLAPVRPDFHKALTIAGGDKAARAGTADFAAMWRKLAENDEFGAVQHHFIQATHYDVLVGKLKKRGFNPDNRSAALRDVLWSTAVQHGPHTNIISKVLNKTGSHVDDELIIRAIYQERSQPGRFRRSTKAVKEAVRKRFQRELKDALAMLDEKPADIQERSPVMMPRIRNSRFSPEGLLNTWSTL